MCGHLLPFTHTLRPQNGIFQAHTQLNLEPLLLIFAVDNLDPGPVALQPPQDAFSDRELIIMRNLLRWMALAACGWVAASLPVQAQNCLPPPAGLVHWWRGEGNGFDSISIQDAVLIGGVQFAPGEVGTGFSFSGSGDDYIALPQNIFPAPVSDTGTTPFSFEVWFQTTVGGGILGQQDLVPFNSTLGGYVPALYVGTNGLLYAQMFWGTGAQLVSTNLVNDGQFHHALVTYDGAVENLYLDGVLIGATPFVQQGYSSNYYYELGTAYTGGWDGAPGEWFPFTGVIDEASLYDRALSPAEAVALFKAGSAGKCAPPGAGLVLRHRYSFDGSPSSLVVTDSVRGANGLLVYGSPGPPYTNGTPDGSAFTGTGTLQLNGSSGCVSLPPRLLSSLSNFTVEAWVTWNGPGTSTWQRVFDFGISDRGTNANGIGTNYVIFTPAQGGSGLPGFEETTVNPFGTVVDPLALVLTGPNPMPIGQEVYVAITYDPLGSSTRMYLNGALVSSSSNTVNATSHFTDYTDWLGRSQWDRDPFFNGSFDEFRVWQGVLTDQDIGSHYAAGPNEQFVSTRPLINIAPGGAGVVLAWPADGTAGFQLQSSSSLLVPAWVTVTNAVTMSNGIYSVALPDSAAAFYRLKQ